MDVSDQGDKYVVDADLPALKKENIEARVGDDGRSITIEGKVINTSQSSIVQTGSDATVQHQVGGIYRLLTRKNNITTQAISNVPEQKALQLSNERPFTRNVTFT